MAETRSVSVRVPKLYYELLEEMDGPSMAGKINDAIKRFVEKSHFEEFVSFGSFGNETLFLTVKKVAELLNLSEQTVRKKCRNGQLRCIRPAKQWLIFASEIREYFKPQVTQA